MDDNPWIFGRVKADSGPGSPRFRPGAWRELGVVARGNFTRILDMSWGSEVEILPKTSMEPSKFIGTMQVSSRPPACRQGWKPVDPEAK